MIELITGNEKITSKPDDIQISYDFIEAIYCDDSKGFFNMAKINQEEGKQIVLKSVIIGFRALINLLLKDRYAKDIFPELRDTVDIKVYYNETYKQEKEEMLYFYYQGHIFEFIDFYKIIRPDMITSNEQVIKYYLCDIYEIPENIMDKMQLLGTELTWQQMKKLVEEKQVQPII